jgi:sugar phosphate isomerase/epimerase
MSGEDSTDIALGRIALGINPYGLTYTLGLQGAGTSRANPDGSGLDGFIEIASRIGAKSIEIFSPWLTELSAAGRAGVRARLADLGIAPIVSAGLSEGIDDPLQNAIDLDARTMRFGLSPILCGDRNAFGAAAFAELITGIRAGLGELAPRAADHDVTIAVENHQDFGSAELLAFAEEAGENVGITLDTANPFPVAESPLSFARAVAHRVRHVHLKDYRVQFTDEGYRLVRCALGDGVVPFREVLGILLSTGQTFTSSLELAALEARHVRLLTPDWWNGYPPKDARALAEVLAAARPNLIPENEDYRTPWERGVDGELIAYENEQLQRSAAFLRSLELFD